MNPTRLSHYLATAALTLCTWGSISATETTQEVPIFITIGQSNADGSAMFDTTEDNRLNTWYSSDDNNGKLKIWYRSCQIQNQSSNALGEAARWVIDGSTTDVQPGWLDLWYRNENTLGRTAMNMIHNYGTYSTGNGTDCAQGRRGMEGEFGMKFAQAFPESELYIIKLGASGSFISSWANPSDNTNWTYFYENMFKPAITDLLARGKKPRLAGIWWMQGCADSGQSREYYEQWLRTLIEKCRRELGFADGKFYIGHIVKPGESTVTPSGSVSFSQEVRDAQDALAADMDGVETIDTKNCAMQYEQAFNGYIHFSHEGVNAIGDLLAEKVIADGENGWATYSTPGRWNANGTSATFIPAVGNPDITYTTNGNEVTATLSYPGWSETKTTTLSENNGPGHLELDGSSRYMVIPNSTDFNIEAGGTLTVSLKAKINQAGTQTFITNRVRRYSGNNNNDVSGWAVYAVPTVVSTSFNYPGNSWNAKHHNSTSALTNDEWHHLCWVYSGNSAKFYVDGVATASPSGVSATNAIPSYADILVGAGYAMADNTAFSIDNLNNFVNGAIDDVRIYRDALGESDVALDRTASEPLDGKNIIAAYDFNNLSGTSATDITGNGHTGTLVGFPDYSATGSLLTIEIPADGNGTITVSDGVQEHASGSKVEDGTVLTVTATPATDYLTEAIYVNGSPINGNTFTMNGASTVSATFVRNPDAPTKVLVFDMNENGSKYYRIPALETAADGSLVALADKRGDALNDLPNTISVVAKRSTDGGETWSEAITIAEGNASTGKTYGDPALVLDRNTGNLVAVFSGDQGFFASTKTDRAGFYVSISSDNGLTWSEPRSISDQIYQPAWYGSFCASGKMLQTKSGRIMFVANSRHSSVWALQDVYEMVCYSDDGGQTWGVLNADTRIPAAGNGNESKLVEMADGTLIMSIRSAGKRRFSKSTDGGKTWSAASYVTDLPDPDCNGDIIVYPSTDGQTRMLHSLPADGSVRRDVSVYLSYDEGGTWPVKRQLIDGYSAYSSLTVLPDGSIGCFVEEGKWDSNLPGDDGFRLYFMKFDLDWLTEGSDNGDQGNDNSDIYDGTLNLDGNRYMVIPNSPDFNIEAGGTLTVSLKAKINQAGTQTFITNRVRRYSGNNNNDVSGWAVYAVPTVVSTSFNYPGNSWNAKHHNSTSALTNDEWHHLCWVYSGNSAKFYVDGVATESPSGVSATNAIPSYADILVGAGYVMADNTAFSIDNLNNFVNGAIDDVRIYRDALGESDVALDRSASEPLDGKNIIAAYDFSKINGLSVTDISGNGHTGTLVGFPENAPGYQITITKPDETEGTLEVFAGETKIASGRKLEQGTAITIVATPATYYTIKEVNVNGSAITPVNGTYTFVTGAEPTTVSAIFERDPDAPVEYCIPSLTVSRTDRYINTLSISDSDDSEAEIEGTGKTSGRAIYADRKTSVFTTSAGATVTFTITDGGGEWVHSYLYIDFGKDGTFDVDPAIIAANGDLVGFDRYDGGAGTFYDSEGNRYSDGHTYLFHRASNMVPSETTFTLPDDIAPGDYTARFKLDWNSVDPCGDTQIATNGGCILDFTIRIESNSPMVPINIAVTGNGTAELWTDGSTNGPAGTKVNNGDMIDPNGTMPYLFVKPDEGWTVESATFGNGENDNQALNLIPTAATAGEYAGWQYCVLPQLTDNNIVAVVFTEDTTSAIDGIGMDPADGPIEMFNMQGIRVNGNTLVPGHYILRQGKKTAKILVK